MAAVQTDQAQDLCDWLNYCQVSGETDTPARMNCGESALSVLANKHQSSGAFSVNSAAQMQGYFT